MARKFIFTFSLIILGYSVSYPTNLFAQAGSSPKEFTLRFAWTEGTTALVKTDNLRKKTQGGRDQRIESSGVFKMSVNALTDKNLAIEFKPHGSPPTVKVNGKPATGPHAWLATIQTMVPTMIVDEAGRFVGVQGIDALRSFMNDTIKQAMGQQALPPQTQRLLDQMLSTQMMTQMAANQWNAVVGFWVGQEFEADTLYEAEAATPLPLPGAPSVMLKSEITVVGEPFPCKAGKDLPICIRLDTVSRPDQAEVKPILESFLKKAAEAAGKDMTILYKELDIITRISLVTEIDTLKPHEYTTEKEVNATMIGPGGEERKGSQVDRRHAVYTY